MYTTNHALLYRHWLYMNYCYLFRKLADGDQDGALTLHEFCVAMKLVLVRRKGDEIPSSLPESLVQLRKKQGKCYITLLVLVLV